MKKILIIEDEDATALALEEYLLSLGYEITNCVNNANDARISVSSLRPDLIISDIMIKGDEDGCSVSKSLYNIYKIPIIFITAHINDDMLDDALKAKAYGYLLKPYKPLELKALIRLTLNHQNHQEKRYVKVGDYEFDIEKKLLLHNKQTIQVGKKSLKLIEVFVEQANQLVTYDYLINSLNAHEDNFNMDSLRHIIQRIKDKLNIDTIVSVRNEGYIWNE